MDGVTLTLYLQKLSNKEISLIDTPFLWPSKKLDYIKYTNMYYQRDFQVGKMNDYDMIDFGKIHSNNAKTSYNIRPKKIWALIEKFAKETYK